MTRKWKIMKKTVGFGECNQTLWSDSMVNRKATNQETSIIRQT